MYRDCTHILRPRKFCFPLVIREKGSKLRKFITGIHKVLLEFSVFSLLLEKLPKNYSLLTLKRCNNLTIKFYVTTFHSLNTKYCNIQSYDISLNTFVNNLI